MESAHFFLHKHHRFPQTSCHTACEQATLALVCTINFCTITVITPVGTVAGRRTNRLVSWNPGRNNWTLNDVEVIWFTFLIIICTFQWISTIHCMNVWAGSSLAWSNAFWHVTVLTSCFSPIPFGGEVLANFSNLQCTVKKILSPDHWFYFMLLFHLNCLSIDSSVSTLLRPWWWCKHKKTPWKFEMHIASFNYHTQGRTFILPILQLLQLFLQHKQV